MTAEIGKTLHAHIEILRNQPFLADLTGLTGGNVVTEPKRTLSQQPVFSLFTFYSSYLWRENVSVNEYSSAVLHVGDGEADDDVLEQPTQAR